VLLWRKRQKNYEGIVGIFKVILVTVAGVVNVTCSIRIVSLKSDKNPNKKGSHMLPCLALAR
jgi:hypothetical protein